MRATQTHTAIATVERRSERNNSRFCFSLGFSPYNKRAEKIAHNISVEIFAQTLGKCFVTFVLNTLSLISVQSRLPFVNSNQLLLLRVYNFFSFSPKQKIQNKNFYSHRVFIAHRNSILIFIFRSVFYRQWNWQCRAALTEPSEIFLNLLINFLFVSSKIECWLACRWYLFCLECKVRAARSKRSERLFMEKKVFLVRLSKLLWLQRKKG